MGHVGQRKGTAKNLKIFFIAFASCVLVGILAWILAGSNGNSKDKTKDEHVAQEYVHAIGDEIEYEGLKIKIYNRHFESYFCGIEESEHAGQTLLIVDVSVTNTTNKKIEFQTGTFFPTPVYTYSLIFDNDYSYNGTFKQYLDFLEAYSEIKPLQTIDASLCFIVPNVVKTDTDKSLKIKFKKNKIDEVDEIHYWIFREGVVE